jgi:cell division protein FtsB|tara:strand:+ start:220 stop:402 length:183 start_codon:yes stop_codon:yes gene_type:complete
MDLLTTLEETYKKEIQQLTSQLYTQYQRNKELVEKISYLESKVSSLEDLLEEYVKEKLNA